MTRADRPPSVMVIVPTHGSSPFLRQSVASVLRQTYEDLQLLIVDNATSIDVAELVRTTGDPRVSMIRHQTDDGSVANIFRAFGHATSPFFLAFHDDDTMSPTMVEHEVALLREREDLVFVGTGYAEVDDPSRMDSHPHVERTVEVFRDPANLVAFMTSVGDIHFGSVMYRTEAVRALTFDPRPFGIFCDRPYLVTLAEKGPAAVLRGPWMNWRRHAGQDTRVLPASVDEVIGLLAFYRDVVRRSGDQRAMRRFVRFSTNELLASYMRLPRERRISFIALVRRGMRDGILEPTGIRRAGMAALARLALRLA
jgi:glycosyltransferase involved in cell wall biosynthesis